MQRQHRLGKPARYLGSLVLLVAISACGAPPATSDPPAQPASPPAATSTSVATAAPATATAAPATATAAPAAAPAATAAPVTSSDGPRYGGTIVVPRWPDEPTCNPAVTTQVLMVKNAFDGLVRMNGDLEPQPELATSWTISPDGTTVSFTLREGVTWHDGRPFTADDVRFTFDQVLKVHHPRGRVAFAVIEAIETPDDRTVIFRLSRPSPAFMYQVATESPIIPAHIYADEDVVEGPHATCEQLPVGTGAFQVTEYVRGERLVLERNPDWWGSEENYWGAGQPYLDRILVPFIPDAVSRVNGLLSGEFDYIGYSMLPLNEARGFETQEGTAVLYECMGPHDQTMLGFNLRDPDAPWADKRVRQAIAWALDRTVINERVHYGTGTPSNMFIPPTHPMYNPAIKEVYMSADSAKAEALLDEAGYPRGPDGTRFELRINYDTRPAKVDLAGILVPVLGDLGIRVVQDAGEYNYWIDKTYQQHDYDVSLLGLGVYELSVGAARVHRSDNIGAANFNNSSAYVNEEVDQLWATYAATFDEEARRDAIYRIQEILIDEVPYIYLNNAIEPAAVNTAEFDGWQSDCLTGYDMFRTVWWKDGRETP